MTCALAASLPAAGPKVREPAVAGLFYPADRDALARTVDDLLAAAPAVEQAGALKAIVCPHAGYTYSGAVAAKAYRQAMGRGFATAIVLAPAHYALVDGASVSDADVFRTPLGDVPMSPKARELGALPPFALAARCRVQRPSWWTQSSRVPPPRGEEDADTWEHADEVQVPFLQRALPGIQLVSVVMGELDPERAARALARVIDERTLVVVSSDLSHFHTDTEARRLDRGCLDALCALDVDRMAGQEACGLTPILTLMHLAKAKGWQARLLDYRTSGDSSGETNRVVGYGAVGFYAPEGAIYSAEERRVLLGHARLALRAAGARQPRPNDEPPKEMAARFGAPKGCFVTLTQRGELRGCIGHIFPREALWDAVRDNARSAALEDTRFDPVRADEVGGLHIEISVLTEPQPLAFSSPDDLLAKLRPHIDGVVLRVGERGATFLPQVWEQLPKKEEFLSHLAAKAGCAPGAWRQPGTRVLIYQVESFEEPEQRGGD